MRINRADDAVCVETGVGQQLRLVAVFNEAVGQAETEEADCTFRMFKRAGDFGAGAADQCVLFDADKQRMFPRQFDNQRLIDGFDETHVGNGGIERFCGRERR